MRSRLKRRIVLTISYILVFIVGFALAYELKAPTIIQTTIEKVSTLPYQNYSASTNVLAVKGDGTSGIMGKAIVEIIPGRGRVLMDTNPFLEPDTQLSAETAVQVAANYTHKSLADKDVILSFNITGNVLGGPSAGSAMTMAAIAAIEQKQLRSDVAITGTIESDGSIGPIGGVLEKAQAAGTNKIKIFLIPKGEALMTYYERQIKTQTIAPGLTIQRIQYVPKTLDVANYTTTEWGMTTKEVSNINEAAAIMLK
jgi:uncharacterized protein